MQAYKSRYRQLSGSSYTEVVRQARYEYHKIQKRTPRRQAYVKSKYFKRDKVFINQFWQHLGQKHPRDRLRRAKLFLCAIDLIRNTTISPVTMVDRETSNYLHRFLGVTSDGIYYYVQIKTNSRTGRNDLMSVFPKTKRGQ